MASTLAALGRLDQFAAASGASNPGFSWVRLAILAIVVAIVVPLLARIRRIASQSRRARWAQEDAAEAETTRREPDDPRQLH